MAKYDNEERFVEDLLTKMPKMIDHRNPEEIYQSIIRKQKETPKKKRAYFIPSIAVAAIAILFILISSTSLQQENNKEVSKDGQSQKIKENMQQSEHQDQFYSADKKSAISNKEKVVEANDLSKEVNQNAVYQEDIQNEEVFSYGLFTKDATVVPISILVPKSNKNWFTRYLNTLKSLPLKKWGFENESIFNGEFEFDQAEKKLHVIVYKKDSKKVPEYVEQNLEHLLQYSFSFSDRVSKVDITDEDGKQVVLNNSEAPMSVTIEKNQDTGYYLYTQLDGKKLLAPSDNKNDTLQEALESMKEAPNDLYGPIIPKNLNIKVESKGMKHAIIRFKNNFDLSHKTDVDHQLMIEGILLTAKSFGYQSVQFENISPINWDKFDFSKPIKVPLSPNLYSIQ
ncbi:anti-sigma-X factor RsiX [Heyndrickxia sporothermodurans]|nr:anti-sigma-X factor RsiX [Heyndrickxia sporothermodurans]